MKRLIFITSNLKSQFFIKTLLMGLALLFAINADGQFRDTKWGMTLEHVKKAEHKDCDEISKDLLICGNDEIANTLFTFSYWFNKGKLYQGRYSTHSIDNSLVPAQSFKNSFYEIARLIGEKYNEKVEVKYQMDGGSKVYTFELKTNSVNISGKCALNPDNHYPKNYIELEYINPQYDEKKEAKSKL